MMCYFKVTVHLIVSDLHRDVTWNGVQGGRKMFWFFFQSVWTAMIAEQETLNDCFTNSLWWLTRKQKILFDTRLDNRNFLEHPDFTVFFWCNINTQAYISYRCISQQVWNLVGFKAAGQEKRFWAPLRKECTQWRLHSGLHTKFRKTHSLRLFLSLLHNVSIFMSLILLSEKLFLPLNQFPPRGLIKSNWIEHELKQIWRCEGSVASLFTYWNEI